MQLRRSQSLVAVLVIALLVSGWGPGSVLAQVASSAVALTVQQTSNGNVLFTGDGKALYMFTFDSVGTATSPAKSACADSCAAAWPPLLAPSADGPFQTSGGVQATGLGTIQRADGTFQVTYFGWPLYTFVADKSAGQTNGQKVANFNGVWYLVSPSGRPSAGIATVTMESSPSGSVLSSPTAFNSFRSLYLLTADPPGASSCGSGCARFWPPLLTSGDPVAGSGVNPAGLGTLRRSDSTRQVTYFGVPLYFFAPDMANGSKSGATNGEDDVDPFNLGTWYLVGPSGSAQPGQASIGSKSTAMGTVLTYGSSANVVYASSADSTGVASCMHLCARIWTPVLTTGAPQAAAGSGVSYADLGTVTRPDGMVQVTFHGRPLYLFAKDYTGTGGQGMTTFGGTFDLVQTSGAVSTVMPASRPVISVPQFVSSGQGTSASFTIAFTSKAPGQGLVYFASGAGCSALTQVATQDVTAGTTNHILTVSGNEMPGSVGDIGIQAGQTYSFEVLTVTSSGTEVDTNNGKCYAVTVPST